MKKLILMWLLLQNVATVAFCAPNRPTAANTKKLDSYADGLTLEALLNPIESLQGNFSQTVKNERGHLLQQLSGKLWMKKPAQFRWQVLGQEPRLIVADGKTVWDFDQDLEQVTIQKLNATQVQAPIFFLTGDVKTINRDFTVAALSFKVAQGSSKVCLSVSNTCFQMTPKKEEGSFQWIKIGFKDKALKEIELLDQLGQYSHILLSEVQLNKPIAAGFFNFKPPKGVDILHND